MSNDCAPPRREWLSLRDPSSQKPFWFHIPTKTKVWHNPFDEQEVVEQAGPGSAEDHKPPAEEKQIAPVVKHSDHPIRPSDSVLRSDEETTARRYPLIPRIALEQICKSELPSV